MRVRRPPGWRPVRVSQDTRTIKKGEWFVAVKGEQYDGHSFVEEALRKGAAGVLEVEELYELAGEKIGQLGSKVIAVTGSYGKTTTKEAVAEVLSSKFEVLRTRGNLNTPLGVAMEAVNNLKPRHQVFVAEVGMDQMGEIRQSGKIISPQVGVITSVGEMHMEKLGTLKNIKKAKSELLESLPLDGTAVLNYDDANVREIAKGFSGKKIWYGFSPKADVDYSRIQGFKFELLGEKSRYSALAAYAVGEIFRIPKENIFKALASLRPQKGRLNLLPGRSGAKIIDDTYNAGPRSARAALEVLEEFPARRKIAVLGDMLELGKLEEKAHFDLVALALEIADLSVFVGGRMGRAYAWYGERNKAKAISLGSLKKLEFKKGDVVLVKGSRGMQMEKVVESLLEDRVE